MKVYPAAYVILQNRKENTTPFSVNLMRSQVSYRAAQVRHPEQVCSEDQLVASWLCLSQELMCRLEPLAPKGLQVLAGHAGQHLTADCVSQL